MSPRSPWFRAAAVGCLLLAAAPAFAAWPHDLYDGNVPLCTATGSQNAPLVVSDGAGGAIVVWQDLRGGVGYDIYARRVDADGNALWTSNGVGVCTATNNQTTPVAISDGQGGVIIAWEDQRSGGNDVYAQRLDANGIALWAANGAVVSNPAGNQYAPSLCSDGANGAIFAWTDTRGVDLDIYAQRLSAAGAALWTANGVAVCNQAGGQFAPRIAWAGTSAIVAWSDERSGALTDDIYGQRLATNGALGWALAGMVIASGAGSQSYPEVTADGLGGVIVVWNDAGSGVNQLRGQRYNSGGSNLWAAGGVDIAATATQQQYPMLESDGQGGALVTWAEIRGATDEDLYAQRISAGGTRLWGATGLALCTAEGVQLVSGGASDGSGGGIFVWRDVRSGSGDIYMQRVTAAGAAQWGSNGALLCGAGGSQGSTGLTPDGQGGAIVAWDDLRTGFLDIYAQRVDHHGQLGDASPHITAVKDVPADQGGQLKLSWDASYLDEDPTFGIFDYRIWRSVPQAALVAGLAARRGVTDDYDVAAETGQLLILPNAAQDYAWELVGTQSAATFASYSLVVATESDSIAGFNKRTVFMVEARSGTSVSSKRWSSAPDSGYSVDNLAPVTPAPFTAQYAAGTAQLHWNPNHEPDLAGYRLYRGASASFVPGPASLVSAQPDTGYADAAGAPYFYKLTAVDVHGNESPVATIQPAGTLGVDGAVFTLSFAVPYPQPARDGATFRFGLPARGEVSLQLFDAAGRRVASVVTGVHEAGEHTLRWDGRDGEGRRLSPGLYLARLSAGGRTLTRRMVTVE